YYRREKIIRERLNVNDSSRHGQIVEEGRGLLTIIFLCPHRILFVTPGVHLSPLLFAQGELLTGDRRREFVTLAIAEVLLFPPGEARHVASGAGGRAS
ncbi:MAG: hypothetical protein M3Q91_14070, partial [Acidobacteriota bacterium]|nr:hypothetical protein [Acidobacteriota bacterium]